MGGLRIIVTRPQAQAGPWVDALRAVGCDAHALPLIDIAPAAEPAPVRAAWGQVAGYALVMFVSANAVQHFFALRPEGAAWPASTLAGSTGPGTTAALRQAGVPASSIVQPLPGAPFDSEGLWARLAASPWLGREVLVVRGEDGRDWLADRLRAAGALVEPVAAYRRLAPTPTPAARTLLDAAVAHPEVHCWLFSSSQAVAHLRDLAHHADWTASHALASHPRIATSARLAGFGDVHLVEPQPSAVAGAIAQLQWQASTP